MPSFTKPSFSQPTEFRSLLQRVYLVNNGSHFLLVDLLSFPTSSQSSAHCTILISIFHHKSLGSSRGLESSFPYSNI